MRRILKKALLLVLAASLLVAGFLFANGRFFNRVDPAALAQEVARNTLAAETYRYNIQVKINVPGGERVLSQIDGEKAGKDFHIWGTINNTKTEVFQVEDITYVRDPLNNRWFATPGNNPLWQEYLMAEINPLAAFNFVELKQVAYTGKEKVRGRKAYVVTTGAEIKHQFLNKWFKDFQFKMWIDPKAKRVVKAEIRGAYKEVMQGTVYLGLEVWDYGKDVAIQPPVKQGLKM